MSEIKAGALVEVVEAYSGDTWPYVAPMGTRVVVEDVVSAEDSEDGVAYINGSSNGGWGNVDAPISALRLILSDEEMKKVSREPKLSDLITLIQHNIHDDMGVLSIDESYATAGDKERGILEFSGTNQYGFRYNATLRITELGVE